MKIRHAAPDDAGDVYDVHASIGGSMPWGDVGECRRHIESMIGLGVPPVVADVDGRVVAEMALWWGQDVPELGNTLDVSMVDVHTDYQRRGIGRALVRHAIALAREKGCGRVSVWTAPEAIGFYRKVGFGDCLRVREYALTPADFAGAAGVEFQPVRLADLVPPNGAHLQTGRILHPRQRWHDMVANEASPPRWKGTDERRQSVIACTAEAPHGSAPIIAVYRLYHWRGDASRAELYVWSPGRDASILAAAAAHGATLGITRLTVLAYGQVADHLAALGAEAVDEELRVLALDVAPDGRQQ